MNSAPDEKTLQVYARVAGLTYVVMTAAFNAPIIISSMIAPFDDFARIAHGVAAAEPLYRVGLASQMAGAMLTILLGGALYVLTKGVSANLALFALLWRTCEATLGGVAVALKFQALENYKAVGASEALHNLIFAGYGAAFNASILYFSIGSTIFFYLLFKSRLIPRWLSGFSVIASVLALAFGFLNILAPQLADAIGMAGWYPILAAEVGSGLWLLLAGVNFKYWREHYR